MEQVRALLESLITQAESLSDQFSAEERALVQEVLGLGLRKFRAGQVDKQEQIPRGAEFLYVLAGGNPQAFANYARQFPDAELNRLAANKTALQNVLGKLSKQIDISKGAVGNIPQADLQSSTVYGFRYDPKQRDLFVKFQGDGVYKYENVAPSVFKLFASGAIPAKTNGRNKYGQWWRGKLPSVGSSLNALIKKGGYRYTKVA